MFLFNHFGQIWSKFLKFDHFSFWPKFWMDRFCNFGDLWIPVSGCLRSQMALFRIFHFWVCWKNFRWLAWFWILKNFYDFENFSLILIFLFLNLEKIKVSDGHFFHFSIFQFLHEGFPKTPLDLSILILIEQFFEHQAPRSKGSDSAVLGLRRPQELMLCCFYA